MVSSRSRRAVPSRISWLVVRPRWIPIVRIPHGRVEGLVRCLAANETQGTCLGTFKQGVSKQGVMTFAWRPGWQYDVAATRGADSALASDCRAQFGLPSTRRGCRICVTVRLPVRPRGETMYWQANANTPLSVTPLLHVPDMQEGHMQEGH